VLVHCVSFFFSSRRRHTRFSRDWSSDVCSSDLFPLTDGDQESVEGMRVTFPATLSILEYFNYGRYGEVVVGTGLGGGRQFQPTRSEERRVGKGGRARGWPGQRESRE